MSRILSVKMIEIRNENQSSKETRKVLKKLLEKHIFGGLMSVCEGFTMAMNGENGSEDEFERKQSGLQAISLPGNYLMQMLSSFFRGSKNEWLINCGGDPWHGRQLLGSEQQPMKRKEKHNHY